MTTKGIVVKYGVIAAVSALAAGTLATGALAVPGVGHAAPAQCKQYGWPDRFQFVARNGLVLEAAGDGKFAQHFVIVKLPPEMALVMKPGMKMQGNVEITGKQFSGRTALENSNDTVFTIGGAVDSDDVARGFIQGAGASEKSFHTDRPLTCIDTAQAPPPEKNPEPQPNPQPDPQPQKTPPVEEKKPLQGPLVSTDPGFTGVTFTVTDRSGVASQCTYSSEGFQTTFGLPANDTVDVFVPAFRLGKTRTGTITCDNGTSTNTSVFY